MKIENQKTIIEMLQKTSNYLPTKIAIQGDQYRISYSELLLYSKKIARNLMGNGVASNQRIVIVANRGYESIFSMVAVWFLGGVIVNVNSDITDKQLEEVATRTESQYVINCTRQNYQISNIKFFNFHTIFQDAKSMEEKDFEIAYPDIESEAYIMFTSGTTGKPKGIVGWHGALSHFIEWQSKQFFSVEDRCLNITNPTFDVMFRDVFTPLVSGATLFIPTDIEKLDSTKIQEYLLENKITHMHIVPTIGNYWILNFTKHENIYLKKTFFAGEPLHELLIKRWRLFFPKCDIINLYGPSETTLAKMFYHVPNQIEYSGIQPVGKCLPGVEMKLDSIDSEGVGEVIIKSKYISKGYIEEKFLNTDEYLTGDLGELLSDGNLILVGRKDDQIKRNGIKINLLDIEKKLADYPGIEMLKIVAKNEEVTQIFAFIKINEKYIKKEFQKFLSLNIRGEIAPNMYYMVDDFPMNKNGKVDRKELLLRVDRYEKIFFSNEEHANNSVEKIILAVFEKITNLRLGVEDNILSFGVNSLTLVQIAVTLSQILKINIKVNEIFNHPSVLELSKHLIKNDKEDKLIIFCNQLVATIKKSKD